MRPSHAQRRIPPKTPVPPTVWGQLATVCRRIHQKLYDEENRTAAKRSQKRLHELLSGIPNDDPAVLRAEAAALLSELQGDWKDAIKHRREEIRRMKQLQRSVARSIRAGQFDAQMGKSILAGRDVVDLETRESILEGLRERARQLKAVRPA